MAALADWASLLGLQRRTSSVIRASEMALLMPSHMTNSILLAVLSHRYVVEVSACTGLCRRQTVAYALGYEGMETYLRSNSCDLSWQQPDWVRDTSGFFATETC